MSDIDYRRTGRATGVLLLLLGIGGSVGNFVLTAPAFAPPGFLVNAAAHSLDLSFSVLVGLATGAIALGIALVLYPPVAQRMPRLALGLVAVATVNFALAAVEQVTVLSLVALSKAYVGAATPDEALWQALRGVVATTRNGSHFIHLLIGGGQLLLVFLALYRCTFVPRLLAGAGVIACLLQMTSLALPIFGRPVVFALLAPVGVVLLATVLWLLAKGLAVHAAARAS